MLKKCRCGVFKTAGHRWRVLQRREDGASLLKCLECNHKWKSRRKYVSRLEDHVERSRSGMTDADILYRLLNRTLIVDANGRFVLSVRDSKASHLQIFERERKGTLYRFVQVCRRSRKKKIAVHRLVWMAHHWKVVPEGFDVDHIRGRNVEFPDGIENLRLLPMEVNRPRTADCPF